MWYICFASYTVQFSEGISLLFSQKSPFLQGICQAAWVGSTQPRPLSFVYSTKPGKINHKNSSHLKEQSQMVTRPSQARWNSSRDFSPYPSQKTRNMHLGSGEVWLSSSTSTSMWNKITTNQKGQDLGKNQEETKL